MLAMDVVYKTEATGATYLTENWSFVTLINFVLHVLHCRFSLCLMKYTIYFCINFEHGQV